MFTGGLGLVGGIAAGSAAEGSVQVANTLDTQVTESPVVPGAPPRRVPGPAVRFKATAVAGTIGLRTVGYSVNEVAQPGQRSSWLLRYRRTLVAIDLSTAAVALLIAYLVRFGPAEAGNRFDVALIGLLPLAWVAVIALNHGYEARFVGVGAAEFQRISHSFLHLTALVAFASFVTRADLARGFVLFALPLALCLDVLGRYAARKWLHAQRAAGRAMKSVLIVGDPDAIKTFTTVLLRDRYAGMQVVGACVPSEVVAETHTIETLSSMQVPLLGDVDSVISAVKASSADTVAVVSSGRIGPEKLRWISWQLEGSETELVVSPGLIEVAGPRLHIQPVAGLPLLHVEEPELTGFRRVLKSGFDRTVAVSALLALSPLFISILLAVRLSSSGPALFRQVRVGRDGRTFTMLKFRSMYTDAEQRLTAIREQNDHGDGVLFKMRNDPRVTTVGRWLRKFSLDELPQLINVVNGSMSLVGPRPPLPSEVARYEAHVHRRFLVKPGVTGLWQVSGRSNLAWDDTVRLDLRYVENWSIAGDLQILWKTMFAVMRGTGAY